MLHLSFKMCQQKQTFCFVYIRKMTTFFLNYFFLAKCRHFSQKILTSHHFMTMLIFFFFYEGLNTPSWTDPLRDFDTWDKKFIFVEILQMKNDEVIVKGYSFNMFAVYPFVEQMQWKIRTEEVNKHKQILSV